MRAEMPDEKIDSAIIHHRNWVLRFKNAMQGITVEKFDIARASDYTSCDFGKWLYGDAKKTVASETLQQITELHQNFHEIAAKIAAMINQYDEAGTRTQLFGQLDEISREFIKLLLTLKRDMQNARSLRFTALSGKIW